MCGIFGIVIPSSSTITTDAAWKVIKTAAKLAQSRGFEASGLAVRFDGKIVVHKRPIPSSKLLEEDAVVDWLGAALNRRAEQRAPLILIGHSRLVTNGRQSLDFNNQPVVRDGVMTIHNGIVVNDNAIWKRHSDLRRIGEVDTEAITALLAKQLRENNASPKAALGSTMKEIDGTASIAVLTERDDSVLLATNCGSLYTLSDENLFAFASERWMVEELASETDSTGHVRQLNSGEGCIVAAETAAPDVFRLAAPSPEKLPFAAPSVARIASLFKKDSEARDSMRRCARCILPETMPFIAFDADGVCNYCRHYQPITYRGVNQLREAVAPFRRDDGRPECLVAVSGGRDSCYGLHLIARELGLKAVAYTYDWGLITDLARRNQARLCGRLGIEHVLVSADIRTKRANVRRNVEAWLRNPKLGLLPLWMAGDKQYFYYADQVRRNNKLELSFLCENRLERAHFKAGFCGIDEVGKRSTNISAVDKIRMLAYYGTNFLANPAFLNRSMVDSFGGFYSFYFIDHGHHLQLFEYMSWDEKEVIDTLRREYDWELANDTCSTWRIGDGTAAFYNYVYYTVAGFTENDTFRSNQIRQGNLSRAEALRLVAVENEPRWESMKWYSEVIGFDLDRAIEVINEMPKLYEGGVQ